MLAGTAFPKLTLVANLGGRVLAFIVLVGLSVPLSAELATLLQDLLPELRVYEGQFGQFVDRYVFDLAVNWPLLALAPITLVDSVLGSLPDNGAIFWSCVGWAPIGLAYAWTTRNRELFFFVLSIYPFMWIIGIALRIVVEAIVGL